MKKYIYLLMLAVTGLITSCGSDDITDGNADNNSMGIFTAETEESGSTRTSISVENNILWSSGDHITIFNKNTNPAEYELIKGAGKTNGSFNKYGASDSGDAGATALNHAVAVYPHNAEYQISASDEGGYIIDNVEIPSVQTYVENNIADGTLPMVAVTPKNILKFKNLGAFIKLDIMSPDEQFGFNKITVQSRSAKKQVIAGKATVTVGADGKNPSITMKEGGSTMITLEVPNIEISPDKTVSTFILLPPMNYTDGLEITLYEGNEVRKKLQTKASDLKRNQILVMPTFNLPPYGPVDLEWVDLGLPSGTLWANKNIGADHPTDYGNYYAWGEISTKTSYTHSTYKHLFYREDGSYGYKYRGDISGNPEEDVATAYYGSEACLPTLEQVWELKNFDLCKWKWLKLYGHCGYQITSYKTNKSIFIPAAGRIYDEELQDTNITGAYWTCEEKERDHSYAWIMLFDHEEITWDRFWRIWGLPARAVKKNK